jgi:hypothetical protein
VVAAQLDVFEARAFAQGVVGEVEHVIGFVVRQRDLQELQAAVDGLDEPESARQGMDGAHASVSRAAVAVADFVMDVNRTLEWSHFCALARATGFAHKAKYVFLFPVAVAAEGGPLLSAKVAPFQNTINIMDVCWR